MTVMTTTTTVTLRYRQEDENLGSEDLGIGRALPSLAVCEPLFRRKVVS